MLKIGQVKIGGRLAPKVLGIINASPESFYKASVRTGEREIAAAAKMMQEQGANIIDVGAMSTAPYLETVIPIEEEIRRMKMAVKAVKGACSLPVSADTPRASVAEEAIEAGADAINDVTGMKHDPRMAEVAAKARVPVIIGAYSKKPATGKFIGTAKALKESLAIAKKAGVRDTIIDPSIGFFREEGKNPFFTKMTDMPWYVRDLEMLDNIDRLAKLGPVCVSVSRKSFIGHLLNTKGDDRLVPSIVCEAIAVLNGASIIRTHSVRETVQGLTMLQLLKP
jgi:dihydropteroate synthase